MTTTHPHSSDRTGLADKRNVKDVADWCRRELETARRTGSLETRPFVQNAALIIAALDFAAATPANSDMAKLAEALTLGRDAVMESFDYVSDKDDQMLADARLQSIDAAIAALRQSPSPAEQDGREAIARCLVNNDRNYSLFHMPGDSPRPVAYSSGWVSETHELSEDAAEAVRKRADAILALRSPSGNGVGMRAITPDAIRAAVENLGYDLKLREFAPRTEIGIRNFSERCEYLAAALAAVEPARGVGPSDLGMNRSEFDREMAMAKGLNAIYGQTELVPDPNSASGYSLRAATLPAPVTAGVGEATIATASSPADSVLSQRLPE